MGTINYDRNRLLTDSDFKEKSIVKGVKLKRQNVSERIIDVIKRLLFTNLLCKCTGLYELYLEYINHLNVFLKLFYCR